MPDKKTAVYDMGDIMRLVAHNLDVKLEDILFKVQIARNSTKIIAEYNNVEGKNEKSL